jgi:hypothetical protein
MQKENDHAGAFLLLHGRSSVVPLEDGRLKLLVFANP